MYGISIKTGNPDKKDRQSAGNGKPANKKRGFPLGNPPRFLPEKAYFAASTVSAAASVAVESACSQAAVESHFSVQASQAEASVAAASVAASSAAAFLLAFPPQLTIATAARTMTKEKIFFIASNVLNMNFFERRKDRYSQIKCKEKMKNFQEQPQITPEGRPPRSLRS